MTELPPSQCGTAVRFNRLTSHIVIGTEEGILTIRQSPSEIETRVVPDFDLGLKSITCLRYSPDYKTLAVGTQENKIVLMNVNKQYQSVRVISGMISYPYQMDWCTESKFIQLTTKAEEYLFFSAEDGKLVENPVSLRESEWAEQTVKFGWNVQGILMGDTNSNLITALCRSNNKKILVTGDDDNNINVMNFPCISDNVISKRYKFTCK